MMGLLDDMFLKKKETVRVRTAKAVPLKKDPEKKQLVTNNNRAQTPQPQSNASIFGSLRRGQSGVATSTPKSIPTTTKTNDVRKAKVSGQPTRTRPPDKEKKPWFRTNNNNILKKDPIKSSTASLNVNSVQKSTLAADSKKKRPISNSTTLADNVTLRRGQNQKIEGQNLPDNLSRTSSITNLDVEPKNNKGAKPRKAASRDRIDKIGDQKKNDKKGVTKNNNKLESNDSPYPSIDSLHEEEFLQLRRQLQEMAQEKSNLALQLGEQKGQLNMLQKEIQNLKEESNMQLEHLTEENTALRNRLRDVAHSPLSDNEKQQLLYETHRHHSSAPASIATNLIDEGNGGDITACPTPDWDKHSSSNVSEVSVACLQDKINQMQETHYSTNEELQATLQELTDLQRQLTELQQENERLNEEKTLMFDSLCRQTERLNDSRSEVESLKQLLYREKDETGQYESAVEREQKLVDLLKSAQEEREGLLVKLEQINNEVQEARAALSEKDERITHLSERVRTLECTLDAKHAEHKQLDQELAQAKDQCSGKQIEINRLTDLLDNARTKISELEQDRALSDKSELDELLDNARKEKDALESEVAHLKEQLAISKNETEKLKEQVSILQEECKVTRNNAKTTQCDLEYKCERLVLEKNVLNNQLQEFQEAINELQVQGQCQLEDKRQLSAVLSETQRNLSEAERKNLTLENEVQELKRLREEENEEWEKFQNDLLTSVRVANDFKTEAQQELQRMIMENKSYRERERQLKAELDKLKGDSTKTEVSTTNSSSRSKSSNKENIPTKEMESLLKLPRRNKERSARGSKESVDVRSDKSKEKKPELLKVVKKRERSRTAAKNRKTLSVEEEILLKSLDDWYEHIDKSIPEVNLTEEDRVIKKLKTLYEDDSLNERPVAPKPKDQLAISKPLLDSVFLNPKLERIAKNPNILTIEEMRNSAIINSENEIPELRNHQQKIARPANIKSDIFGMLEPKRISIIGRSKSYDDINNFEEEKESRILHRYKETDDLRKESPLKRFTRSSTILPSDSASNPRYSDFAIVVNQEASERELQNNQVSKVPSINFETLDRILAFVPENVPEHELSGEQQLALRLKRALDEAERKNTLKKMQKNKDIYISPPTIESVQRNSRLMDILLHPGIKSVQRRNSETDSKNIALARTDTLRQSKSYEDISFTFQLEPSKSEKCVVVEDNCTVELNVSLTKDSEVNIKMDLTQPLEESKYLVEDTVKDSDQVEYDSLEYNETLQKSQKSNKKNRISKYREHIFDDEPLVPNLDEELHFATFENDLMYNETLRKRLELDQIACDQENQRKIVESRDEPQLSDIGQVDFINKPLFLHEKVFVVEDDYFDYVRLQVAHSCDLGVSEQSSSIVDHTKLESLEEDIMEDKMVEPKLHYLELSKSNENAVTNIRVDDEYKSKKPEPLKRNRMFPKEDKEIFDDITAAKTLESILLEKPKSLRNNRNSAPLETVQTDNKHEQTDQVINQPILVLERSTNDVAKQETDVNNKQINVAPSLHGGIAEKQYIDNNSNKTHCERVEFREHVNNSAKDKEEAGTLHEMSDILDEFEKRISYLRGKEVLIDETNPLEIKEITSEEISSSKKYSDVYTNYDIQEVINDTDFLTDMQTSPVDYISGDKPDISVTIPGRIDDNNLLLSEPDTVSGLKHYENMTLNTADDNEVAEDKGEYDYHSILKENRYGVVSPLNIRLAYKDVVKEIKYKFPQNEESNVIEEVEDDVEEQNNTFFDEFFGVRRKETEKEMKTNSQIGTSVDDIDKEMEEIFEKYLHTPLAKVITQIEEKEDDKSFKEPDLNVIEKTSEKNDSVDVTLANDDDASTGNSFQDFKQAEAKDDNLAKNKGQNLEEIVLIIDDSQRNLVEEIVETKKISSSYMDQIDEKVNNPSELADNKILSCNIDKELVLTEKITTEKQVPNIIESVNLNVAFNTPDKEDLVESNILNIDDVEEHLTPEELNLVRSVQNVRYSRPLSDFNEADLQMIQAISLHYIPEKHDHEDEDYLNKNLILEKQKEEYPDSETTDVQPQFEDLGSGIDEHEFKAEISNSIIILEPNDRTDYVIGSEEQRVCDADRNKTDSTEKNIQEIPSAENADCKKISEGASDENEVKVEISNNIIILEPYETVDYIIDRNKTDRTENNLQLIPSDLSVAEKADGKKINEGALDLPPQFRDFESGIDDNEVKVEIPNNVITLESNELLDYVIESKEQRVCDADKNENDSTEKNIQATLSAKKIMSSSAEENADGKKINEGEPDLYAILAKYLPPKFIPPQEGSDIAKNKEISNPEEIKQPKPKAKLRHKPIIQKEDFYGSLVPAFKISTDTKDNENLKDHDATEENAIETEGKREIIFDDTERKLNDDESKIIPVFDLTKEPNVDEVIRWKPDLEKDLAQITVEPKDSTSSVHAEDDEKILIEEKIPILIDSQGEQNVRSGREESYPIRNIPPVTSYEGKEQNQNVIKENLDHEIQKLQMHDKGTNVNEELKIIVCVEDVSKDNNETEKFNVLQLDEHKKHHVYYVDFSDVSYDLAIVEELRPPMEVSVKDVYCEPNEKSYIELHGVPIKETEIQQPGILENKIQKENALQMEKMSSLPESIGSNDNRRVIYQDNSIKDSGSVPDRSILHPDNKGVENVKVRSKPQEDSDFDRILARISASRSSANISDRSRSISDIKMRISGFSREEEPKVKKSSPINPNVYLRRTGYEGVKSKLDYFSKNIEASPDKRQSYNTSANKPESDRRVKSCAEIFEKRTLDNSLPYEPVYANVRAVSPSISSRPTVPPKAEKKPLPVPRSKNPSSQVSVENLDAVKTVQNDNSLKNSNMSECKIISENDSDNVPQEVPNSEFASVGVLDIPMYYAASKIVIDRPKRHEPEKHEVEKQKVQAQKNKEGAGIDKSEKFLDRLRGNNDENLASGAENSYSSIAVAGKFEQLDITKHNDDIEEIDSNNDSNLNLFHLETSSYDESYLNLFKLPEDKVYDDISGLKRPQKGYFNIAYLGEVSDNESYEEFGQPKLEHNEKLEGSESKPKIIDFVPLDDATKPVFKKDNLNKPNYDTLEREKTFHVLNTAATTAKVRKSTTDIDDRSSSMTSGSRTSFSAAKKVFEALLEANMDKKTDDKLKKKK